MTFRRLTALLMVLACSGLAWPALGASNPCTCSSGPTVEDTCGNCAWDSKTCEVWTCTTGTDCPSGVGTSSEVDGCQSWPPPNYTVQCSTASLDMTTCATCATINQDGGLACENLIVLVGLVAANKGVLELQYTSVDGTNLTSTLTAPAGIASVDSSIGSTSFTFQLDSSMSDYTFMDYVDSGGKKTVVEWTNSKQVLSATYESSEEIEVTDSTEQASGSYGFYLWFENSQGTFRSKDPTIYIPRSGSGPG